MKIERIEHGVAKKWEFIYYDDYMSIKKFKYPLREGKSYTVLYDKNKNEIYVDSKQNLLIRIKNITNFARYKKIARNFQRELYLKSARIYPPPYSKVIIRYFAKYILEGQGTSFEISADDYSINSNFFEVVSKIIIDDSLKYCGLE